MILLIYHVVNAHVFTVVVVFLVSPSTVVMDMKAYLNTQTWWRHFGVS